MDFLKRTTIGQALEYYGIEGNANKVLTEAIMSGATEDARGVVQSDERIENIVRNVGRSSAYLAGDYYLTPEEKNALIAVSALGGVGGTLALQRIGRTRAGRAVIQSAKGASKKLVGGSARVFAKTTKLLVSTPIKAISRPFSTRKVGDKTPSVRSESTKKTVERRKDLRKQVGKVTARGPGETAKDLGVGTIGAVKSSKPVSLFKKAASKVEMAVYKKTPAFIYDPVIRTYTKVAPKVGSVVSAPKRVLSAAAKRILRGRTRGLLFGASKSGLVKLRKPRMSIRGKKKRRKNSSGKLVKRRKPRMSIRNKRSTKFGESDETWFQKAGNWISEAGQKTGEAVESTGGWIHEKTASVPGYVLSRTYTGKDGEPIDKYTGVGGSWYVGSNWQNMSEKQKKAFRKAYPDCTTIEDCPEDAERWFKSEREDFLATKYPWKFWAPDEGGLTGDILRLPGYSAYHIYQTAGENPLGVAALAGTGYALGSAIGSEKSVKALKAVGKGIKTGAKGVGAVGVGAGKLGVLTVAGGTKLAAGGVTKGVQKAGSAIRIGTGVALGRRSIVEGLEEIIYGPEYTLEAKAKARDELAELRKKEIEELATEKIKKIEAAAAAKPLTERQRKKLAKERAQKEARELATREQKRRLGLTVERPKIKTGIILGTAEKLPTFIPEDTIGLWPEESKKILKKIPKKGREAIERAGRRVGKRY